MILKILFDIKSDGAAYKIMEFGGQTIRDMSVDSRLTLSNMSVEAGAKAGIIEPDEKTLEYLKIVSPGGFYFPVSDAGAKYENVFEYNACEIEPLVACPGNVDIVKKAAELDNISINQAFLGSCTNGRLEDLETAAKILSGKKINQDVRFIVVPASREIMVNAVRKGYIQVLVEAGAMINHPSCGLCAGRSGGIVENGERVISSNNRNFLGRMGGSKAEIYLASPATVAASALEGKITDPRKYL
jgi:3-isopropylmalate/(R)-2-methylmalate dehydratase large subunit